MSVEEVIQEVIRLAVGSGVLSLPAALLFIVLVAVLIVAVRSGVLKPPPKTDDWPSDQNVPVDPPKSDWEPDPEQPGGPNAQGG